MILTPETVYRGAPVSARVADYLALQYAYPNAERLASVLPAQAKVIDVGAGRSNLGATICALRDDIDWVNFDIFYGENKLTQKLKRQAPPNLTFETGDATRLEEIYGSECFDRVFSYWMMPHINAASQKLAYRAARSMMAITVVNGHVQVGPNVVDYNSDGSQTATRSTDSGTNERSAALLTEITRMGPIWNALFRTSDMLTQYIRQIRSDTQSCYNSANDSARQGKQKIHTY